MTEEILSAANVRDLFEFTNEKREKVLLLVGGQSIWTTCANFFEKKVHFFGIG